MEELREFRFVHPAYVPAKLSVLNFRLYKKETVLSTVFFYAYLFMKKVFPGTLRLQSAF